jgi:DNA-binding NarL/FixJ family response regulator
VRERELLAAVATGKSDAAIADSLFLAKETVETQVKSIFGKLGLRDSHNDSERAIGTLVFLAQERSNL